MTDDIGRITVNSPQRMALLSEITRLTQSHETDGLVILAEAVGQLQRLGKDGAEPAPKEISRKAYVDKAPPIIGEIVELVVGGAAERQAVMTILHDTVRDLKRAIKRAEILPAEYERVELVQSFGPVIEFSGRMLADAEFESRGRDQQAVHLALWETSAGAWIAVTSSTPERGRAIVSATVVPPGDDEQARRFAVMQQFAWHDRARSMVRKLGWSLRKDVA